MKYDTDRYSKPSLKQIPWLRRDLPDVVKNPLHSIISFGVETADKLELYEPIEVIIVNSGEYPEYYGLCEIVEIKKTIIANLTPEDFLRNKEGFKSKRQTIETLRNRHPEYRSDITLGTPVTVVTVRRNSYSLKELNRGVRKSDIPVKVLGKEV